MRNENWWFASTVVLRALVGNVTIQSDEHDDALTSTVIRRWARQVIMFIPYTIKRL